MSRSILYTLLLLLLLTACKPETLIKYDEGKTPLVELEGEVLYREDVQMVLPLNLSPLDSARFVQEYIQNWVSELLLFRNAERNIRNDQRITKLVENYRRSLILHEYQRRLIEQKIEQEITEEEIERFYLDNCNLFILDESVLKGLFIKLPLTAPNIGGIRRLCQSADEESYDEIEKYCIQNSPYYEFFYDEWHLVPTIEVLLPTIEKGLDRMLQSKRFIEVQDSAFIYLLNVSDYIQAGSIAPKEQARERILRLLINTKEIYYLKKIKKELFESALDNNRIVLHTIE